MPQQDQYATELNHAEEVDGVSFPAAAESAEVLQPGKEPLDFPTPQVTTEWPSILRSSAFVFAVGRDQLHSVLALQPLIQRIAVVSAIPNHALRHSAYVALAERVFDQFRLMWRSACNPDGDRKTMAVRDCHDLAPFTAACWTNAIAPFFAPMKEASMKVSSKPSSPRASRSSHSAQRMPSRTPAPCQCWKRRWQVWYAPYRGGKSFQGAPVRKIHSTPSSTRRASVQRPPRPSGRCRCCRSHSTKGLTYSHCASVRSAMPFICFNFAPEASVYLGATLVR
jgi:hypothetical protein